MAELSFAASFEPYRLGDVGLSWDDDFVVISGVDALEQAIRLREIVRVEACHPWPAVRLSWNEGSGQRRLLLHPRGLARLVPASDGARASFTHFATRVAALVTRLERTRTKIVRGWLDDPPVAWTRRDALPGARTGSDGYRDVVRTDALLAHARVERPLWHRIRVAIWRWLGKPRDPLPIELAISEQEVWIVDDASAVWGVPRRALRAIYTDTDRIACIFGQSTFLATSIARSPIRDALVTVANRVIAQNDELRAIEPSG